MQETQLQCLGQEDPLEKEMSTHSSILAWQILWTQEPGRLHSMGARRSQTRLKDETAATAAVGSDGKVSACNAGDPDSILR